MLLSDVKALNYVLCHENHGFPNDPSYLKLPAHERVEVVKLDKLCLIV